MQRRLSLLRFLDERGDLAHLRLLTGGIDHRTPTPIGDDGAAIDEVGALGNRQIGIFQRRDGLAHRERLAREHRLFHFEIRRLDQTGIGGDLGPGIKQDDIARDDLRSRKAQLHAAIHIGTVAHNFGFGRGLRFERLQRGFSLVFLEEANEGVDDDDDADHHRVGGLAGEQRNDRRCQQHED